MLKCSKIMKGVSFLLCLGFLVCAADAFAKSKDSKIEGLTNKLMDKDTYGECQAAWSIIQTYNGKVLNRDGWKDKKDTAQSNLDNACAKFKKDKQSYNSCMKGEMGSSKSYYEALQKASNELSQVESTLLTLYNDATAAADACKQHIKAQKDAKKQQEEAEKKAEEARKAKEAATQAQQAADDAEVAYYEAVKNCDATGQDCDKLKSLRQDYEKKAKAAGKAVKAEAKASNKSEAQNQKAQNASNAADNTKCAAGEHYYNGACTSQDKLNLYQCSHLGSNLIFDVTTGSCETQETLNNIKCNGSAYDAKTKTCAKPANSALGGDASGLGVDLGGGDGQGGAGGVDGRTMDEAKQALAESQGRPSCEAVSKTGEDRGTFGIFNYLACKITIVVADVRAIVYILAGFGMIAFAYGAIIGKINFKQLANIFIGLFILSMTTGFIEAVVFNDGTSRLPYGDFLPNGNHAQFNSVSANCANNPALCPDAQLAGMESAAKNSSWSLKDLKNSINSAKSAIKTASDTYKTVKNTVDTAINAAENIGNAIKNGGDITDVINNIAANVNNVVQTTNMAANQIANAASSISGDIRDVGSSAEQRAYREALQNEYDILKGKCDTGNCSPNELKALENLANQVAANKTGTDKWLENDGKGGGSTFLNGLNNAANITQGAAGVAHNVAQAQNEGSGLAGGTLGDILGVGYAVTEAYTSGSDAYNAAKNNGDLDFRSGQTKAADEAAARQKAAQESCAAKGGTWDGSQCKKGNSVIDLKTGTATTTSTDANGNTTTSSVGTDKNGNKVETREVKDKDGNTTERTTLTTNSDGSQTITTTGANGRTQTGTLDNKGNVTNVNGHNTAANDCIAKGYLNDKGECVPDPSKKAGCIELFGEKAWKDGKCEGKK